MSGSAAGPLIERSTRLRCLDSTEGELLTDTAGENATLNFDQPIIGWKIPTDGTGKLARFQPTTD